MVSGGAPALVALVAPLVVRVSGSKAAQSQTREQVTRASVNHGALLLGIERAARQGDGQELVWPQRCIVSPRAVNHVKAATHGRAPEAPEVRSRLRRHVFILGRGLVDGARKFRRAQERVVPERVHLHGLADSRRHHPVPGLGVHPRQLHARFARVEEPVRRVDVDVVAGAAQVPVDNFRQQGEKASQQLPVVRGGVVLAYGFEEPERGVRRVVFRGLAALGKAVRKQAAVHEPGKGLEDAARRGRLPGGESQASQADHGVASPVGEPRIARDHRARLGVGGQGAANDELVGGENQLTYPGGRRVRRAVRQARHRERARASAIRQQRARR